MYTENAVRRFPEKDFPATFVPSVPFRNRRKRGKKIAKAAGMVDKGKGLI
jgi:hypothetical protein